MAAGKHRQLAKPVGHLEPLGERLNERHPGLLMPPVTGKDRLGRQGLAQVVSQRGVTHRSRRANTRRVAQREHDVHPSVDLRMPLGRLGHSKQRIDLGKDHTQRITAAKHLKVHVRPSLTERAFSLLPDALGYQGIDFARGGHPGHQLQRLIRDAKSQLRIARCKARDAQDAHGVFNERVRDMT